MGQDDRHDRSSVDSLPPELDDIDSSWDDDPPLGKVAEIPVADAAELEVDRVTEVPLVPAEQYAARLMAEVEAGESQDAGSQPAPRGELDSAPELEIAEPGPDSGSLRLDDELETADGRHALVPDEPLPQPQNEPLPEGPRPVPALSLNLSEPGGADTVSVPPLFTPAEAPTAPPRHMRRAPSRELDDLPLDLSDPTRPTLEPPDDEPIVSSLELDVSNGPVAAKPGGAISDMKDRYAMGDFTGALVIAEGILESDPEDVEAQRYVQSCREVLTQMYAARLGQLDQRVSVAIPPDQIRWLSLDHRAGFLLSLIDGSCSIEELLDVSGMSRLDALRILFNLLEQRVIALEPA